MSRETVMSWATKSGIATVILVALGFAAHHAAPVIYQDVTKRIDKLDEEVASERAYNRDVLQKLVTESNQGRAELRMVVEKNTEAIERNTKALQQIR